MRYPFIILLSASLALTSCVKKGSNPQDPYESINRKVHTFNMAFDAVVVRPPALVYRKVIPAPIRYCVNNFFNHIGMLPILGNDILQWDWRFALKDTWRIFINSTIGVGGLLDPATQMGLPRHLNDFGLTLAKWGDKNSPFIMLPFVGPSTIRDTMGMVYDIALFSPYYYIDDVTISYALTGLGITDARTQYFDQEKLIRQALDKYVFVRDAYLQHRAYQISGKMPGVAERSLGDLYVDEEVSESEPDHPDASVIPPVRLEHEMRS